MRRRWLCGRMSPVKCASGLSSYVGEERFRQALSGLAIGAGLRGTRTLSVRKAMRDQAGNSRSAVLPL